MEKVVWSGTVPTDCQLCSGILGGLFVDGRIQGTGQWAIMCSHCHVSDGCGLGTGKGQMYIRIDNKADINFGKFVKIGG